MFNYWSGKSGWIDTWISYWLIEYDAIKWDYLALKVNSQSKAVELRKEYSQPRGFDARWVMKGEKSADWLPVPCRYIHDKIYGMALDNTCNNLQS